MRKIIVSINVTLDGFMAGPNCELDWHFNYWNEEMSRSITKQLCEADTILLGKNTYGGMARHFSTPDASLKTPREDIDFADMLYHYPKIVFTTTMLVVGWNNVSFFRGNIYKKVTWLKNQPGKDMIIYGSGKLVSSLAKLGLIDEYRLWIHPVLLGNGKPLFKNQQQPVSLNLYKTETFTSGVVILYYKVSHS